MTQYFVSYHGGRPFKNEAEAQTNQARWSTWMKNLGGAVVNFGTPLVGGKVVAEDGSVTDDAGDERLTGYSVVEATDIDAALDMVKDCPFLEIGTLRVAEMRSM